jgi:hypothetical protein
VLNEMLLRIDSRSVIYLTVKGGLTLEERQQILRNHIFVQNIEFGNPSDDNTIHSRTVAKNIDTGTASSRDEDKRHKDAVTFVTNENEKSLESDNEEFDLRDDADHERLCCICLAEYQPGDRVLRGETCRHQFHWQCCLEWMAKPQDQCPYCRVLLVSVPTFRKGALQCLGVKRVEEMGAGMIEMTQTTPVATTSATPDDVEANATRTTQMSTSAINFELCPNNQTLEQQDHGTPHSNERC